MLREYCRICSRTAGSSRGKYVGIMYLLDLFTDLVLIVMDGLLYLLSPQISRIQ